MRFLGAMVISLVAAWPVLGHQPRDLSTEYGMQYLETALDAFEIDCKRFPTTAEGCFSALFGRPSNVSMESWRGPYLRGHIRDAWDRDFVYVCPGVRNTNGFDLYSLGGDGVSKTGGNDPDDINNWDRSRHWVNYYYAHPQRARWITEVFL